MSWLPLSWILYAGWNKKDKEHAQLLLLSHSLVSSWLGSQEGGGCTMAGKQWLGSQVSLCMMAGGWWKRNRQIAPSYVLLVFAVVFLVLVMGGMVLVGWGCWLTCKNWKRSMWGSNSSSSAYYYHRVVVKKTTDTQKCSQFTINDGHSHIKSYNYSIIHFHLTLP